AIRTLRFQLSKLDSQVGPGTKKAIKLGIEALKLVKRLRHPEFLRYLCLLPGETED
ncbi:hypothetical protein LCGC14_3077560, partial [marine sediment metagenome]